MSDHWIQVLPARGSRIGRRFDLLNPTPEMIDFDAMAVILSRTPRFTGHTEQGVLPVGQHCTEGAYGILRDTGDRAAAAAFLLHDGHEYAFGDLATPIAGAIAEAAAQTQASGHTSDGTVRNAVVAGIKRIKHGIDAAIYAAAGLPWPLPASSACLVAEYDLRMLRTERDARLAMPPERWHWKIERAEPVKGVDVSAKARWRVEHEFREALFDLVGIDVRLSAPRGYPDFA